MEKEINISLMKENINQIILDSYLSKYYGKIHIFYPSENSIQIRIFADDSILLKNLYEIVSDAILKSLK